MAEESGTPLRMLFAKFFVSWDTKGFSAGAQAVDGLAGKLQQFGQALVGGAIVSGIVALTRSVIHQGDQLTTTAERLGIATQALQQWQYVADLADVSAEELSGGLRILQRNLFAAKEGGAEQAKAFSNLGVSMADLKDLDLDAVLTKMADAFKETEDPIKRTALAQQVFGRGGAALVPLLARGSEGIKELKDEFVALGGGLNDETIEAANQADDAFKRLRLGVKSLVSNAMLPFIKVAIATSTWLKDVIIRFREMSKGSEIVKAALIALTAVAVAAALPIIVAWAPVIATTLAWAAALTGAILILDDIITLFQGGESVIGDWIEQNFGEGSAKAFVEGVKEVWNSIKESVTPVLESLKGDVLQDMRDGLRDAAELVKTIVAGFRYLASVRGGTKDIVDPNSWLGRTLGKNTNGGAAGVSGLPVNAAGSFAVPGMTVAPDQAPPTFAKPTTFGEGGSFFSTGSTGLAIPAPLVPPSVLTSVPPPTVQGKGGQNAETIIQQSLNLTVAPEAKPDPKLVPMIKQAVQEGFDQMNRETAAGM